MIKHRTRLAVLLLATGLGAASCGGPGPSTDPGNRLLHALAADPVFAGLPPGAVRTGWQEKPAKWRSSWFGGGGWDGPAVALTFTSSQSVRDVYRFYAQRAAGGCWTPWQKLSAGFTGSWLKRTTGTLSVLSLYGKFDIHSVSLTDAGTPRSYTLNASGTSLPKNGPQPKGFPPPPAHAPGRCGSGSTPGEAPTG